MTELAQKAYNRLLELDEDYQDIVAEWLLGFIESEAYLDDDEDGIEESLGRFVNEDGSIKFDEVNANAITMTLDEFYDESQSS